MLSGAFVALIAVLLDWLFGEPRRFHPLVGFGHLADKLEAKLYGGSMLAKNRRRLRGLLAVLLLLLPFTVTAALITQTYPGPLFSVFILTIALGHKSLHDHARPVATALRNNDEAEARRQVSRMVSRDSETLDIEGAAVESILENGNDAVFGTLFRFAIAGSAGVVFYRLSNTLDAMWGYRNTRYRDFGWAAARLDDVLNLIPARLTALTYAALGKTRQALHCWRSQAPGWDSPNAGPVMAAGAGALGIAIGGPARYRGRWHQRPVLGTGKTADIDDIEQALRLVRQGVWLWLVLFILAGWFSHAQA
ncbi:MAG: cobalamin biosynthesis protein [Gammaproteobacteria bacterium]|nr:cobalamin biosynthesis protein [Gammaproteobacteria bacterium]